MKKFLLMMVLASPIYASEQQPKKVVTQVNNAPDATPRISMMKKFQEQEEKDGTLYLTREQLLALVKPVTQERK